MSARTATPVPGQLVMDFDVAPVPRPPRQARRSPAAAVTDTLPLDPPPAREPRRRPGPRWPAYTATFEIIDDRDKLVEDAGQPTTAHGTKEHVTRPALMDGPPATTPSRPGPEDTRRRHAAARKTGGLAQHGGWPTKEPEGQGPEAWVARRLSVRHSPSPNRPAASDFSGSSPGPELVSGQEPHDRAHDRRRKATALRSVELPLTAAASLLAPTVPATAARGHGAARNTTAKTHVVVRRERSICGADPECGAPAEASRAPGVAAAPGVGGRPAPAGPGAGPAAGRCRALAAGCRGPPAGRAPDAGPAARRRRPRARTTERNPYATQKVGT